MGAYSKMWGAMVGSAVGLGVAYGFVPESTGANITAAANTLIPIAFSMFGTWIAPRNQH